MRRLCCRIAEERGVQAEEVAIPVETGPGEVAQVDFGYIGKLLCYWTNVLRRAWVFVMVLGYSRHMYAEVAFDQKTTARSSRGSTKPCSAGGLRPPGQALEEGPGRGHRKSLEDFDFHFNPKVPKAKIIAHDLLKQLRAARGDGTYERRLLRFTSPHLLILDDLGLTRALTPEESIDLYDLIRLRYERGSL